MVRKDKTQKEFEELLLEVRKVTRVTTGGRRMSFRATVLVGNKKGKIGLGLSKGVDVTSSIKKASNEAYKNMFEVPVTKDKSVPYSIVNKYKSCIVKILPATPGTGLKAGSSVRSTLDLAGYENVLSKIIGSNNKLNNAIATINALMKYKHPDHFTATDKEEKKGSKVEKFKKDEKKVEKKEGTKGKKFLVKSDVKKTVVKSVAKKPVTKKTTVKKADTKKTVKK